MKNANGPCIGEKFSLRPAALALAAHRNDIVVVYLYQFKKICPFDELKGLCSGA